MNAYSQKTDSRLVYPILNENLNYLKNSKNSDQCLRDVSNNWIETENYINLYFHFIPANETIGGSIASKSLTFESQLNITDTTMSVIRENPNLEIVKEAKNILLTIKEIIFLYRFLGFDLNYLPCLYARNVDDGSLLIEWIFSDFRIGFSIEPILKDSSWHLVSKENLGAISASGYISSESRNSIIQWLISFILSNC